MDWFATLADSPNGDVAAGKHNGSVGPGTCEHEHFSMALIDETLDIDIEDMFQMLFSDSPLFREFIRRRRTYGKRTARIRSSDPTRGCVAL
jgi:hypothetical protein